MSLLAVDPGNERSAILLYERDLRRPIWWLYASNDEIIDELRHGHHGQGRMAAIEMVASYGMPVGREVFETCVWIGRFAQTWCDRTGRLPELVYRRDVKLHLCGSARAKDSNVRQALIDRYGPGKERAVGRKATPGPLYGLTGDCWAALGVAVTSADMRPEAASCAA